MRILTDETIDYASLHVRQLGDIYEGLLGGRNSHCNVCHGERASASRWIRRLGIDGHNPPDKVRPLENRRMAQSAPDPFGPFRR